MKNTEEYLRLILGLKVRQQREKIGKPAKQIAKEAGLSVSYLNEIEKGKKYPKAEKLSTLAAALQMDYDELVSRKLDKALQPVGALLESSFWQSLPLEHFGLELPKVVQLITETPTANAFFSTLIEIARSYDMRQENLFFSALRSYQELHNNYFAEVEAAAKTFAQAHGLWQGEECIGSTQLQALLTEKYNYRFSTESLTDHEALSQYRTVQVPGEHPTLVINPNLQAEQKAFACARELGFLALGLSPRPLTSPLTQVSSFDVVLNNFLASYFAGALLMPEGQVLADIKAWFGQGQWSGEPLQAMLQRYGVSPETLMYRFTNLLPRHLGLDQLFFLRFNSPLNQEHYALTKELHLSQLHQPHGSAFDEHYCRRWVSVRAIQQAKAAWDQQAEERPLVLAQTSSYHNTPNQYFCITMARPLTKLDRQVASVTLGLQVNSKMKRVLKFWQDADIPVRTVNQTCENCAIDDCQKRAADPVKVWQRQKQQKEQDALAQLARELNAGQ